MNSSEIIKKTTRNFWQKWSLAFKIMPIIIVVAILKFVAHDYGFEVMELNALFTSLVAGTIFLIGFLISGVLSDYKESEKIPSELSASLRTLFDDTYTIYKVKDSVTAAQFLEFQKSFAHSLMLWFYKKERTRVILDKISRMNDYFIELDKEGVQAGYIIRMKNEQHNIRKFILRIDTIRDTDFVKTAYAILEAMGLIIAIGMIVIKIQPFYASLFFTLIVTFLISYMFFLIRDLDNPFDYSDKGEGGTEISLNPLHQVIETFDEFKI
jgi:predicted membrane chloride channel (bestrophin family)